jgi:hypothetical protein
MAPNLQNTVSGSGSPIHYELPQRMDKSARVSPSFPLFQQAGELPYSTSQLPVRAGLDSLLTAVNIAMKIDEPSLQSHTDSIVYNMDARVAAVEEHCLKTTLRPAPDEQLDTPFNHGTHPIPQLTRSSLAPLTEAGLGITEAHQSQSIASIEKNTGKLQMKNFVTRDLDSKTIADMNDAHSMTKQLADVDIAPEAEGPHKSVRRPHGCISKRELKILWDSSPLRRKRQRTPKSSDSALDCERQ